MRLLVVGAAGQVGSRLAALAAAAGDEVHASYHSRPPMLDAVAPLELDKTDRSAVEAAVARLRPDAIVDTAALHNVDYCEGHPDEAFRVNRDGSRNLAEAARKVGAAFAFVSTDFVFDGAGSPPYSETDPARPISVYGQSKLEGERAVIAAHPEAAVARPSVVYSWVPIDRRGPSSSGKPLNFGSWLLGEVEAGRPVRIVNDQVASPTLADDLAEALRALIARNGHGLFHTAGATPLSRFEFAQRLVSAAGSDPTLVHPVATAELRQLARRPLNSSLRSDRIAATVGHRMLDLDAAIGRFLAQRRSG